MVASKMHFDNALVNFGDVTKNHLPKIAQKAYNIAILFQQLSQIVDKLQISSPITIQALDGAVLLASMYRSHIVDNKLLSQLRLLLNDFNGNVISQGCFSEEAQHLILSCDVSNECFDAIAYTHSRLQSLYSTLISIFCRSTATLREDVEGTNIIELLEMVGAGKHDSYDLNYSLTEVVHSVKKTWASTFSFQACGDYFGLGQNDNWLHLDCDMPVILMPQVFPIDGGSAIGFSDTSGSIASLSYGDGKKGEVLVGGEFEGKSIEILNDQVIYKSESTNLPDNVFASLGKIILYLHKIKKHPQDTEWTVGKLFEGGELLVVPVQFRTNGPLYADMLNDIVQEHEIVSEPTVTPAIRGLTVNRMCAVGEVITLADEAAVKSATKAEIQGKIVLSPKAYTSLPGLFTFKPAAIVSEDGNLKCHFSIMAKGRRVPASVNAKTGRLQCTSVHTLLHGDLFEGDLSSAFKIKEVDLREAILPNKGTRMKAVFGDVTNPGQLYAYLRLGIVDGITLFRDEEAGWTGDIPSPLSFVYFNQINEENPQGAITKSRIHDLMDAYKTSDPKEAYVLAKAAKAASIFAVCKEFDAPCSYRLYGGRLDEDKPYLLPGTLPADCYPSEINPYLGYNGVAMYMEEWGKLVYEMSLMVLKKIKEYGFETDLFIPNVSTPEGLEWCLSKASSLGVHQSDFPLKLMIENGFATHCISDYVSLGAKKMGGGLNDLSYLAGFDGRNLTSVEDRCNFRHPVWQKIITNLYLECNDFGMQTESCGAADGAVPALVNGGCQFIGTPLSSDIVEIAALIREC